MMKKSRGRFCSIVSLVVVLLLCTLICSCSRLGNLKFCEKSDEEGKKPTVCGSKFSIGEISLLLENRGNVGESEIYFKFFDKSAGDKIPFLVVSAEADPESNIVIADVELYNAGSFRVVAEKMDGTPLGSDELIIIDLE